MKSYAWLARLFLGASLTLGGVVGCEDDSTPPPPVDAAVDAGPECIPGPVGQETCKNSYGERYFCNDDGACAELAPCETIDCCSPGVMGNEYCVNLCQLPDNCPAEAEAFGAGSICEPNQGNGTCTERACIDCTYDEAGHGCCSEALGEAWYCGGGGRCVESPTCEANDCCVPGAQGDAYCIENFGQASACGLVGNTGRCLMMQVPPCADCRDTAEDHACCAAEFGERWYCSPLEGICRATSGCQLDECCVPGAPGDQGCIERIGPDSRCVITERDGRCSAPE